MNWYKTSQNFNLPDNFEIKPGSCDLAALTLTKKILDQGITDFKIIEGYINFINSGWEYDGQIIDPTNTQWGYDPSRIQYVEKNRKEYSPLKYLEYCQKIPEESK